MKTILHIFSYSDNAPFLQGVQNPKVVPRAGEWVKPDAASQPYEVVRVTHIYTEDARVIAVYVKEVF